MNNREEGRKLIKELNKEQTDLHIYGLLQIRGEFRSPLIDRIRDWFDKSGDKVKLKRKIKELEQQVDLLKAMLKGK